MDDSTATDQKYKKTLLSFSLILITFLGIADVLVVNHQRSLFLEQAREHTLHELDHLGSMAGEAFRRRGHEGVKKVIKGWIQEHPEPLEIKVLQPDGSLRFRYKKEMEADYSFQAQKKVNARDRHVLTLVLVQDLTEAAKGFKKLALGLAVGSILLTWILATVLWQTLKSMDSEPHS